MKLATLVDRTLRAAATLTAIVSLWMILMVGVMANDSDTPAGLAASTVILLGGFGVVIWVVMCSIKPLILSRRLSRFPSLRFILVKLPSYAFGVAGIAFCICVPIYKVYKQHEILAHYPHH